MKTYVYAYTDPAEGIEAGVSIVGLERITLHGDFLRSLSKEERRALVPYVTTEDSLFYRGGELHAPAAPGIVNDEGRIPRLWKTTAAHPRGLHEHLMQLVENAPLEEPPVEEVRWVERVEDAAGDPVVVHHVFVGGMRAGCPLEDLIDSDGRPRADLPAEGGMFRWSYWTTGQAVWVDRYENGALVSSKRWIGSVPTSRVQKGDCDGLYWKNVVKPDAVWEWHEERADEDREPG